MTQYNIYYGTIGKTLGVRYRFTKWCKSEQDAKQCAENAVTSLFYKNEGKFGLPSYRQIAQEAEITGVDIETLYKEHIKDMCRWFVIPVEEDVVPTKKLKY